MVTVWVFGQRRLDLGGQAVPPGAHVCDASCNADPDTGGGVCRSCAQTVKDQLEQRGIGAGVDADNCIGDDNLDKAC